MDERGFVKISGRLKDMIIRGGENIYPREIENLLHEHPKVKLAVVVGVPDPYWGEQVAAVIIPKDPNDPPTATELFEFCRAQLTHFKAPRLWTFVGDVPRTLTGKLQKFKLRDAIAKGELPAEAK
jgi:fatty-acyl-CoA synthase